MLPIRVYFEDTDCGGVVYHANFLKFCERGRSDFIRLLGIDAQGLANPEAGEPAIFVVRHIEIDYLKPGRMDDIARNRHHLRRDRQREPQAAPGRDARRDAHRPRCRHRRAGRRARASRSDWAHSSDTRFNDSLTKRVKRRSAGIASPSAAGAASAGVRVNRPKFSHIRSQKVGISRAKGGLSGDCRIAPRSDARCEPLARGANARAGTLGAHATRP